MSTHARTKNLTCEIQAELLTNGLNDYQNSNFQREGCSINVLLLTQCAAFRRESIGSFFRARGVLAHTVGVFNDVRNFKIGDQVFAFSDARMGCHDQNRSAL